jgi:hypothetical protein
MKKSDFYQKTLEEIDRIKILRIVASDHTITLRSRSQRALLVFQAGQ